MISSFIQGGLGNQLFQIAAGASLAEDVNTDFVLNEGQHYLPLQGNNISTYKNNIFKNIKFSKFVGDHCKNFYRYESMEYREIPKQNNLMLFGYFQSEKYFKHNADFIKSLFYVKKIDVPKNSVSIHFRRGDYSNNQKMHPLLNSEYYYNALDLIQNYSQVFVFTDSTIPDNFKIKNVKIINLNNDYDEFCFMSSCDHNIIANSTFSWWAAYLNNNKEKVVVAPSNWFGEAGPTSWSDIYCEDWKVL